MNRKFLVYCHKCGCDIYRASDRSDGTCFDCRTKYNREYARKRAEKKRKEKLSTVEVS